MNRLQSTLCALMLLAALNATCASPKDALAIAERLQGELQALRVRTEALQRELDELRRGAASTAVPGNAAAIANSAEPEADSATIDLGAGAGAGAGATEVDLSERQLPTFAGSVDDGEHVLERRWWNNLDVYGFAAAGYYDTGAAGTRDNGSFEIKEATVHIEAEVWSDVGFFLELQTNRLGADDSKFVRTGEVYVWFRTLELFGEPIGLKLGRIDVPFGEEYLAQDAIDNPLITTTAAYPYGWDEGVLIYGGDERFGWIFAVTDGTDTRSRDDNGEKAANLKLHGQVNDTLYAALSLMRNGGSSESAIEFGGSHLEPIGAVGRSTLGNSASARVDSRLAQLDLKFDFRSHDVPATLALAYGVAELDDHDARFDRGLRWYSVEPFLQLSRDWYLALRFSEIATDDGDEGFHFDGKTFAGGNAAFGDDAQRFRRWAAGIGWHPNPRIRAKLELGADSFETIGASSLRPRNDDRGFVGFEVAVGF